MSTGLSYGTKLGPVVPSKEAFHVWWQTRRIQLQGSPGLLPPAVLCLEGIQRVYEDFHANFKSFEAWNGRARRDVLQHKHQQGREQVFRELRKDRSQTVDSLQFHHTHIVGDVDPDSHQVFLEEPVDSRGHSSWQLEGQPCRVTEVDGQLCQVVSSERPIVGQELTQRQIITSAADIQAEFARHWAAKWQRHAGVEVGFWRRALDFCNAYLPACSFDLPPLNIKTWNKALQRYKPLAARGVDGFAKSDLVNMPPPMKQELISFLSRIESGDADWPAQMLIGLIMNLDKEFNTLPRAPVFLAASRLGIPNFLIQAWDKFLGGLSRSFVVHGEAGEQILSSTGFPEGDPMSTVAMTIIDWAWHLYLQQYAPSSVPLSFVDNFSCMARDTAGLAQALTCTRSFADMWSLEIDGVKTFAWALRPASKRALKRLWLMLLKTWEVS